MTISQTPAPARSDLRPTGGTTTPDHPFRWHGRMLSVGALMWAGVMVFTGTAPEITGIEAVAFGIGSGAFQIGLLCLLRVLWRTRALGDGRLSRFFLRAETVALSLAIWAWQEIIRSVPVPFRVSRAKSRSPGLASRTSVSPAGK